MGNDDDIEALERYYRLRAPEYEAVYNRADTVRRAELKAAAEMLKSAVRGRRVLEVACGTGFWTEVVAGFARDIVAIDTSAEMLELAAKKVYPAENVLLMHADAYRLHDIPGDFDAGVASFWISHVPRRRLDVFLRAFHRRLGEGARVFMMDNFNTPGYGGELVDDPASEDTFKLRELADGSKHRVIKNYFDVPALRDVFAPLSTSLAIDSGTYYWWVSYEVASV